MFLQETPGTAKLGFETKAWMKWMCLLFDAPRDLGASKVLSRLQSHVCFSGTLLYESFWRQRTEIQDKDGHLWVPADCELSSSLKALESRADIIYKPPLKKE